MKPSIFKRYCVSLKAFLGEESEWYQFIQLGQFLPIDNWRIWKNPWGYVCEFGDRIPTIYNEETEETVLLNVKYFQSIETSIEECDNFLSCYIGKDHLIYFLHQNGLKFYLNNFPTELTKLGHDLILLLLSNKDVNKRWSNKKIKNQNVANLFIGDKEFLMKNINEVFDNG